MATFLYDGKSNLTATAADTVVITADPTLFTQATQNLNDAVLRFGANTLTITGATLSTTGANSLQNVQLGGGNFVVGQNGAQLGDGSSLVISTDANNTGTIITGLTTATSKTAIFGGNGVSSPNDLGTIAQIGGQGSFLVYGNGGDDTIRQGTSGTNGTAFDSTSAVSVFGGKGGDVINLSTVNNKGSLLILGGESTDSISVLNVGNTTIFGGVGAGDSADGADSIALIGATGGTINVFGNGGADIISGTLGSSTALTTFTNGAVANIFGGTGSDSIAIGFDTGSSAKGTVTVYGGEDSDFIRVVNTGTTTIYGGTGQGDSTDGADSISLGASGGTITVYGNAGADIISGTGLSAASATTFAEGTNAVVFGGKGNDAINLGFDGTAKGTLAVYGGEDNDAIIVSNGAGGSTTVFGGTGQGDSADGADTITLLGQGNANLFGNGGNDTINLGGFTGAAGAASANVVTVYGGAGNDTINVSNLVNGQSTLNLNGNEGNDTFVFGTAGATEVATVTFGDLANTQVFSLAGIQVTATGTVTAASIAAAFAGKAAGAAANTFTIANATVSGTFAGYNAGAATGAGSNVVALTSTTIEAPVGDLTPGGTNASTQSVTVTTQGVASATAGNGLGASINDFAIGSDKLTIQNGIVGGGTASITTVPTGGFADLQTALNAASQGAQGSVSAVAFGGSTYVVTNNATPGFDINADVAIKLTGITDVNGVVNAITIL